MVMKKLNKRLFRLIEKTKGQYIAVVLIIATGIFIFTSMSNASINLKQTLLNYYITSSFPDLFVESTSINDKTIAKLIATNEIDKIEGRIVKEAPFINDDNERVNVRAISVDSHENKINKLHMRAGKRNISNNEVIVIDQFAKGRSININDEISLQINGKKYNFTVAGIASSPEFVYLMENAQTMLPNPSKYGIIFIEENYFKNIGGTSNNYNELLITLTDPLHTDKTIDDIEETLKITGLKRITKRKDQLSNSMISQEIDGLEKTSSSIPMIFLFFAAIMLSSMLSRIIKNDKTGIGVLKALGYSNKDIILHYLKYALSVGLCGGIIGSIIGLVLSSAMTNMYMVYFNLPSYAIKINITNVFIAMFLACIFSMIAGFYGVRRIVNISPAESMRPSPPKKSKRILLEKCNFIWSRLSFSWKMVFRNIFREKKKFALISAGVAMTCSMLIMTFWMNDIFYSMFNDHYGKFMKTDYNIAFNNFQDISSIKELKKILETDEIEGRIEFPFELSYGKNKKAVNVIGLNQNTIFYNFKDLEGNQINIPDNGIILSSNLAKSLNVSVGDDVLIEDSYFNDDDIYLKVTSITQQMLGINAYLNIDYMNNLLIDKQVINGAYLNSNKDVVKLLEDAKNIGNIQSQKDMINMFKEFTGLMTISILFMVLFSGILGFAIIYSMTIMSINERTLEFSSLRVLGFYKNEIFNLIVKENTLMSLIGVLAGIPLGIILISYTQTMFSTDIYTLTGQVTFKNIIISISLTFVFIIFAQLLTYKKIHKLNFIEALKTRIS